MISIYHISHVLLLSEFKGGTFMAQPWRWHSGLERSTRKRKVGCSNPSRDRPKSLKQGCPVSNRVWHAIEPSLLNGHKCRA